uniref:Uncharacterized protein n=1 Tax=Lepeophtheirus salmonis TaxID=72036 RepID=A0A0K2UHM6_LEPSM
MAYIFKKIKLKFYPRKKLIFISEQLAFVNFPHKRRCYSPRLLAISLLWHNTSPALYCQVSAYSMTTLFK